MFDGQFTNVFLSCPSPPSGGQAYFHIYSWWCLIGLPELLHLLSGEYLLWYRQKLFYLSPQTNSPAILRGFDTFFCFVSYNTLESPLTARRSNQSILKEINPEYSSEGLMLKLQHFGHLTQSWFIGKDPDAGKDWRQEEKGMTEDEMVGWHHRLNGQEFE